MLGSKISDAPQNPSFAACFMYLELRREGTKEDYMEMGKPRRILDYRIVNKIMCFLKGD